MKNLIADIRRHPIPFAVGALGLTVGFALLLCSKGTNDIWTWENFAKEIQANGLFALYAKDASFNHPPLMGLLAWISLGVSSLLGTPFAYLFKLFPVLANVGAAIVLWALWRSRADSREGALAFALFGWALCPMFVGSYHGNTDCTAAFFCLCSVYLLEVRRRPFLGGLALAAAINVKIVPLLVALPLLAAFRSFTGARQFVLGSATAALPFLIALLGAGPVFLTNVFGYGSSAEMWGMQMVLASLQPLPGMEPDTIGAIHGWYFANGKYVLVIAILALVAYGARYRLGHAQLAAAAMSLFLLLTPGFGVQYTAYPAPLIFAVSLGWGMKYSIVAGIYIGFVYASWSVDAFPLESVYRGYPPALGFLGFAVWLITLGFLPSCLRRRRGNRPVPTASGMPSLAESRPTEPA